MHSRTIMAAAIITVAGLAAACSGAGTASPPASLAATAQSATPTTAPASAPAASLPAPSASAPSAAPSGPAASGSTIEAAAVGSRGTLIVASSNGMTVYTFSKDTADSGSSACTGSCLATWPAADRAGWLDGFRRQRGRRQDRDDHAIGRRLAPGDVQRTPAVLLRGRSREGRFERRLYRLVGRQTMTRRAMVETGRASPRRVAWLLMVALPVVLAACGKGGTSGY